MPGADRNKSKREWISDCISIRQDEHPGEKQDKSVAVCHSMYRDLHGGKGKKK